MSENTIDVGRRIAVIGTSGSGKSYVAQALAKALGLSYISNDAIIWRPDWQETPHEERVAAIDVATRCEDWTFDGNVAARHPDDRMVLERCDTIVWLDLPRWQVWSQVAFRTLRRVLSREELWHGNSKSLLKTFFRDSIVLYSVRTFSRRRRTYEALFADPAFAERHLVRLRSRGEVDRFLHDLSAERSSPTTSSA